MDQETTLVNDPMFSQEAIGIFSGKFEKSLERKSRKIKTMATETAVEKCQFCGGNHDVEQCEDFKKLTVNERSKTFFRKRLCYGCCKPISDGHNLKTCNKRRKCKTCDVKHLTVLHGLKIKKKDNKHENNNEENKEVKGNGTGVNCASLKVNQIISRCVVPVKVRLKESGSMVET